MINIITIPQGTASSTTQSFVVEVTEELCKKICVNNGAALSGTVSFSAGTPVIVNDTAIVPITATGAIVMNSGSCGCNVRTRHFSEKFNIAFESTTDNDVTLTVGTNNIVAYTDASCCHTNKVRLTTTLSATIA